ncbi:hypothetical protein V2J09_022249 [Rumex salicifolius]
MTSVLCSQSIRNDTSPEHEEAPRLSFCDLLESTHWDAINSDNNNGKSSCSKEEDEGMIFDFFGSHSGFSFAAPPTTHPQENIRFCGKQMTPNKTSTKKNNFKKKVLNWIMPSSSFSSSSSKQRAKKQKIGPEYDDGNSRSRNRRWWMVMFGSIRVPNEMDLSDIKTRQKRRPPQSIKAFVAMFDDHQQQINKLGMETKMKTKTSSSINGLIGLVRSFSCKI